MEDAMHMRFALINNERVEAAPNLKGLCPVCAQPVIAKCGTQRIWHWAHRGKIVCDRWRETETQWHRAWKDKFPRECQEIIQYDPSSGEKHIADVRTDHGLVIEFQHSHLDPHERAARERFYGNMVWVVDGSRLKKDYSRFLKGRIHLEPTGKNGYFLTKRPEACFPLNWLESTVRVIFDFQGVIPADHPPDRIRNTLWYLLPGRAEGHAVVIGLSRTQFVTLASSLPILLDAPRSIREVASSIQLSIENQRKQQYLQELHFIYRRRTTRPQRRGYPRL